MKSFLQDGEATSYEGVTVRYVAGRSAVMTIYDENGNEIEKVALHTLHSKKEMHALMQSKGFQFKNGVNMEQFRNKDQEEKKNQSEHQARREVVIQGYQTKNQDVLYPSMFLLFVGVALSLVIAVCRVSSRMRKRRLPRPTKF